MIESILEYGLCWRTDVPRVSSVGVYGGSGLGLIEVSI